MRLGRCCPFRASEKNSTRPAAPQFLQASTCKRGATCKWGPERAGGRLSLEDTRRTRRTWWRRRAKRAVRWAPGGCKIDSRLPLITKRAPRVPAGASIDRSVGGVPRPLGRPVALNIFASGGRARGFVWCAAPLASDARRDKLRPRQMPKRSGAGRHRVGCGPFSKAAERTKGTINHWGARRGARPAHSSAGWLAGGPVENLTIVCCRRRPRARAPDSQPLGPHASWASSGRDHLRSRRAG